VSPVTGLATKRKGTHVAAYSRRGVGLRARRPGESTTTVPIPEHLRAGEGGISQPLLRSHQARRSYAHKGGIRGRSHRGRPYGQRTRERCPEHLRVQIRGGAHRREEMGAHLRRPRLQHPRGPKTLPTPKRGRVPRTRASLEDGKANSPVRWPLTNSRASLVIHPRVVTRGRGRGFTRSSGTNCQSVFATFDARMVGGGKG
jgi:hypothetical protein